MAEPSNPTVADLVLAQVRPTPPPRLPGPFEPASHPIAVSVGFPGLFDVTIPIASKPRLYLAGAALLGMGFVGGVGAAAVAHFLRGRRA
jgi:hypothetical protein